MNQPGSRQIRFDTCVEAAREAGIRFHLLRGSSSMGQSQGGIPPDDQVDREADILADCARLIRTHHDPEPGAMMRVDLAPGSPFAVTARLMQQSVELARRHGVGGHTHPAQSAEDEQCMHAKHGRSSVEMAEEWWPEDSWSGSTCLRSLTVTTDWPAPSWREPRSAPASRSPGLSGVGRIHTNQPPLDRDAPQVMADTATLKTALAVNGVHGGCSV